MKREKSTGPKLKPRERAYKKGKMSSWKEASRNKFVGKGKVPDRVESFGEVDSSKNRQRVWSEFVKLIRNRPRKEQILIQSRLTVRVEKPAWHRETQQNNTYKNARKAKINSRTMKML